MSILFTVNCGLHVYVRCSPCRIGLPHRLVRGREKSARRSGRLDAFCAVSGGRGGRGRCGRLCTSIPIPRQIRMIPTAITTLLLMLSPLLRSLRAKIHLVDYSIFRRQMQCKRGPTSVGPPVACLRFCGLLRLFAALRHCVKCSSPNKHPR